MIAKLYLISFLLYTFTITNTLAACGNAYKQLLDEGKTKEEAVAELEEMGDYLISNKCDTDTGYCNYFVEVVQRYMKETDKGVDPRNIFAEHMDFFESVTDSPDNDRNNLSYLASLNRDYDIEFDGVKIKKGFINVDKEDITVSSKNRMELIKISAKARYA